MPFKSGQTIKEREERHQTQKNRTPEACGCEFHKFAEYQQIYKL